MPLCVYKVLTAIIPELAFVTTWLLSRVLGFS